MTTCLERKIKTTKNWVYPGGLLIFISASDLFYDCSFFRNKRWKQIASDYNEYGLRFDRIIYSTLKLHRNTRDWIWFCEAWNNKKAERKTQTLLKQVTGNWTDARIGGKVGYNLVESHRVLYKIRNIFRAKVKFPGRKKQFLLEIYLEHQKLIHFQESSWWRKTEGHEKWDTIGIKSFNDNTVSPAFQFSIFLKNLLEKQENTLISSIFSQKGVNEESIMNSRKIIACQYI